MKRNLVAIVVIFLLVGAFVILQWSRRWAQARWAAAVTPQPANTPTAVQDLPAQSRWTATATMPAASSNAPGRGN
jgi:hypothetical protein